MRVRTYRDLRVWKQAVDLAVDVYQLTRTFPREELYGLTAQVRKSGVSIPSNIAEGHARQSDPTFYYHLGVAHGSLAELDTQLVIAQRLDFTDPKLIDAVFSTTQRVGQLIRSLRGVLLRDNPQLNPRRGG